MCCVYVESKILMLLQKQKCLYINKEFITIRVCNSHIVPTAIINLGRALAVSSKYDTL